MKKLICVLATLALVMCTYLPARAEYLGTLPKDQEWAIEVTSSANNDITLTVYYLGHNLDVIDAEMTVHPGTVVQRTFPKTGARVKRIIIEVDTPRVGAPRLPSPAATERSILRSIWTAPAGWSSTSSE